MEKEAQGLKKSFFEKNDSRLRKLFRLHKVTHCIIPCMHVAGWGKLRTFATLSLKDVFLVPHWNVQKDRSFENTGEEKRKYIRLSLE